MCSACPERIGSLFSQEPLPDREPFNRQLPLEMGPTAHSFPKVAEPGIPVLSQAWGAAARPHVGCCPSAPISLKGGNVGMCFSSRPTEGVPTPGGVPPPLEGCPHLWDIRVLSGISPFFDVFGLK